MYRFILSFFSIFITLSFLGVMANSAYAASYAIAPFKINASEGFQYLQKAIPPMFNSRLFLAGVNEPIAKQNELINTSPVVDIKVAETTRKKFNADYLVFGSVTILGENASLDVTVIGDNQTWSKASQSNVNNLFDAVQHISNSINQEIFGRKMTTRQSTSIAPINSEIISNEITPNTGASSSYLNPDLRYQGTESQRTRSKPLDYAAYGFEIADFNQDGIQEIAVLSRTEINIYRFENTGDMTLLSNFKLPTVYEPLRIRTLEQHGKMYLVLAANDTSNNSAQSSIFAIKNNKLERVARSNYYLNVASTSPAERPVLIGQMSDNTRFVRGSVYQMIFDGHDTIKRGKTVNLPKEANVFNFTWLPSGRQNTGTHLIVIDDDDKMITYDSKGKRLSKTDDLYASTGVGVKVTRDISGFVSTEGSQDLIYHYIPMRVLVADLDGNGQYEAITSKPISTATMYLQNYRNYSQGEVAAQIWDGIGMTLLWKTRRIKGTIIDVELADPNNDGVLDLVVSVNSYPGTTGVGKIRNTILLYPLETSNIDTSAINFSE